MKWLLRSKRVLAVLGTAWVALGADGMAGTLRVVVEPEAALQAERTNEAGERWTVTRLSYLLSGVSLQRADGTWLRLPDVAWMNAATKREALNLQEVPAGRYEALRFDVGLSAEDDAQDPATRGPEHPLNPRVNGLHWSWQGGYIFLALEGNWRDAAGKTSGYAFHLGREAFRTEVTLPCALDLQKDAALKVGFDVATVLKGISFARDGTTTHSRGDDPVAVMLRENLKQAFRLKSVQTEGVKVAPKGNPSPMKATPLSLVFGTSFPQPKLPTDNPLTAERVSLGRMLFHETALSRDGTISCASCHQAGAALTDVRRFSVGVEGREGDRNTMPLFNLAWKDSFFWDGRAPSLRAQSLMPIVDHREMDESLERVVAKLGKEKRYTEAFQAAFGSPEVTAEGMGLAMENFLLTLTSHDSKFDRAQRGEGELTADERRGFELFMMEREPRLGTLGADCFHCHGGALFTDHQFRNNGLKVMAEDTGRHRVTGAGLDKGTFATPSLRNIALTAPYMHDGRFGTLEEVLDHYSEGVVRTDTLDPNLAKHPDGGLHLTAEDKRCVIAFLKTLTDIRFTDDARPDKN